MPSRPRPIVTRSNISVVSAVPQPLPTPPTTASASSCDVVEEDLVELGLAGDLAQPADRHALGVHRHDEHRQALVLGHVGVGAREQQAVGGELRVGRPHLLAVEHASCRRPAGARASAPPARSEPAAGSENSWHQTSSPWSIGAEVAALLLVGAVGDDRRAEHADADRVEDARHAGACAISWLTMTCSIGPMPWPPNSFGQVTPASPPSASLPCHARRAATYLVLVAQRARALERRAPRPCAPRARRAPSRGTRPARACRSRSTWSPLADWPVGPRNIRVRPTGRRAWSRLGRGARGP